MRRSGAYFYQLEFKYSDILSNIILIQPQKRKTVMIEHALELKEIKTNSLLIDTLPLHECLETLTRYSCPNKICLKQCHCTSFTMNYYPDDLNKIIHSGILVRNPNSSALKMKEGIITYQQIDGIPISQIFKLKIRFRKDLILSTTLQIYLKDSDQPKPIRIALDKDESQTWFLRVIQAKLAVIHHYKIVDSYNIFPQISGTIYKKTAFGKWKRHHGTCNVAFPRRFKLEDEFSSINTTSQMWTRFQFVMESGVPCLIVKLWGALGKKQLAIPLPQLTMWLTAFSHLLG